MSGRTSIGISRPCQLGVTDETRYRPSLRQPGAAARKLVELTKAMEAVQDGRIHTEKINAPFLYTLKASGPEFGAGIKCAVERGWLELHESGTDVRLLSPEGPLT